MKRKWLYGIVMISIGLIITGCGHEHIWQEATCVESKVCMECGDTEGESLGHVWTEATCVAPKTCSVCTMTEGEPLGHSWLEASYDAPQTCDKCGETQGESLGVMANEYYEMGRKFLYGFGETEINLEFAYNNFLQSKEMGMIDANFYLGLLCDWYNYPEKDYEKAKVYYEACEDNLYAQVGLGYLYYFGQGVEEDKEKAEEIFQTVVEKGCVEGYLGIAEIAYEAGDYSKEVECYSKVLEGTESIYIAYAMECLGSMYRYGNGVEQDYFKAMEWFEKAADLGYSDSMTALGYLYNVGEGVEQDYVRAMEWYLQAADLGNATAMSNIGYLYRYGNGVEQDYAKAMEWYLQAADLGNSIAMNSIGMMYGNGEGVEQDYNKALEWHKKAADLGNADAIKNVEYLEGIL